MNHERKNVSHRNVRSLSRGLALIQELNVMGPSTVQQLSNRTGLNRTTCYRLLGTLLQEEYVTFDEETGVFALTAKVRMLSEGVSTADLANQAARPSMFALLNKVSWPSDFALFEVGSMVIRESTHSFSPFTIERSMVGRRRSLVRSSLGFAVLSAASPTRRRQMLELTASLIPEDAQLARDDRFIKDIVLRTRKDGYASAVGLAVHGISAIAVPINGRKPMIGSLNLIFYSSAMSPALAAHRYLGHLRAAAKDIEARLRAVFKRR